MAVVITWTHSWSSSDDGTIFYGVDLANLQADIEGHSHDDAATRYSAGFTDANLSSGILTVTHNIGNKYVLLQVYDNNDKRIIPDDVTLSSTTACAVDLSSYGTITGTWRVVVF